MFSINQQNNIKGPIEEKMLLKSERKYEIKTEKNNIDLQESFNSSHEISQMIDFNDTKKSLNVSFLNKKRRKFDIIHDHILMLGLFNHGKRYNFLLKYFLQIFSQIVFLIFLM